MLRITEQDNNYITDMFKELYEHTKGVEDTCDVICYNLDDTDYWFCVSISDSGDFEYTLSSNADIAGYPKGEVYISGIVYKNFIKDIFENT